MFSRILVPLDCSKYAESSLKVAIEIAKKFNSSISLIHVVSSREEYCRGGITGKVLVKCDVIQVNEEDIPKICNELLNRSKKKVTSEGVSVHTILKQGKVVEEILNTIEKGEYDLVVMGSRGQSSIKKIFVGSVSTGVIQKAICPVLLTRI